MTRPEPPAWFVRALAAAPERRDVQVGGTRIHYRAWGDPALPGLVLVHGGAAHSGWWDHVAPQLVSHRVLAIDLSGHGDSARRTVYDPTLWASEVVAVAAAEGLVRPVVIGHSMGGWVAVTTGVLHPERVRAVAVLDSPLFDQPPEEESLAKRRRPTRIYDTREEADSRFTTLPLQDVVLPYVRDNVAQQSLHEVAGGWTWKFDPACFGRRPPLRDLLPQLATPVALFRSEHGIVTPKMTADMAALIGRPLTVVDIPDAGHHPMLDQPLALVTGLRTLLALWPSADARRQPLSRTTGGGGAGFCDESLSRERSI